MRTTSRINSKKQTIPKYIILKLLKTKHNEKILKAVKEKKTNHLQKPQIRINIDFSSETMKAKKQTNTMEWHL